MASNRELERSNKELETFAYIASHDLKEPVRTVMTNVQMLQQHLQDPVDADAAHYMQVAVEGSERMHRLINDVLDYSEVRKSGYQFQSPH